MLYDSYGGKIDCRTHIIPSVHIISIASAFIYTSLFFFWPLVYYSLNTSCQNSRTLTNSSLSNPLDIFKMDLSDWRVAHHSIHVNTKKNTRKFVTYSPARKGIGCILSQLFLFFLYRNYQHTVGCTVSCYTSPFWEDKINSFVKVLESYLIEQMPK